MSDIRSNPNYSLLLSDLQKVVESNIERQKEDQNLIKKYSHFFSISGIEELTPEIFRQFTMFSENKHWNGIHRHNTKILEDFSKLKESLAYLIDDSIDVTERLYEVREGRHKIPGLGLSILTPILTISNPTKFPVFNTKVKSVLKSYNLYLFKEKETVRKRYPFLIELLSALSSDLGVNLLELDYLWHALKVSNVKSISNNDKRFEGFKAEAFHLLAAYAKKPIYETYKSNESDYKAYLKAPMADLFADLADEFEDFFEGRLETKKNLISRITKQNAPQNGIWNYYWAAFYDKESKSKSQSTQFYAIAYADFIHFGVGFGKAGQLYRENLERNLERFEDFAGEYFDYLTSKDYHISVDVDRIPSTSKDLEGITEDRVLKAIEAKDTFTICLKEQMQSVIDQGSDFEETVRGCFWDLVPLFAMTLSGDLSNIISKWSKVFELGSIDSFDSTDKEEFSKFDALDSLFMSEQEFDDVFNLLQYKKNLILQGPPGTGKTFISKLLAYTMMEETDDSKIEMVQFHQSYSYEDFIQGIRPDKDGNFVTKNGVFYDFCLEARANKDKKYFFIIDEINRGNLSKIFGELLMLVEADKRGKENQISLTYAKNREERFWIPENVFIIGTMNTADRSLALVDYALRRRFAFYDLNPAYKSNKYRKFLIEKNVPQEVADEIIYKISALNKRIASEYKGLGSGFCIGHSYFCPRDGISSFEQWYKNIIKYEIGPLLKEYFFDEEEIADKEIEKLVA